MHTLSHRLVSHHRGGGSLQLLLNNNTTWNRRASRCDISTYASTYPRLSSAQTIDVPYRDDRRKLVEKFGHDYIQVGQPIDTTTCKLTEDKIHNMIRNRMECRKTRDYVKADEILQKMNMARVHVDDRMKQWMVVRPRPKTAKDCQTIKELVELTHGNLTDNKLNTRNLSAFWSALQHLMMQKDTTGILEDENSALPAQLDSLLARTMEDINSFGYRDLSQTTIALSKIVKCVGGSEETTFQPGSSQQILRNLLIGKNSESKRFIFRHMACASLHILPDFDPRHLSNFIYAFAVAQYVPSFDDGSTLFDILATKVIADLINYNSQDITNTLWAYSNRNANEANSALYKEAGDIICAHKNLNEFKPQELSSLLLAYAKANEFHPELFNKVADHIASLDSLNQFKPQELSSLVWAFATVNKPHPRLFEKVADHIVGLGNLKQFKAQALVNITWSYATLNESHSQLFKMIADHIVGLDNLDKFIPRGLSNLVWAYATINKKTYIFADELNPKLLNKVAHHIIGLDNLTSFNGQDFASILWAYATAQESQPKLYEKFAEHIVSLDNLDKFECQALSNIPWAYATAKESHPALFQKLVDAAFIRQHEFTSLGIVNFLWAYASNGQIDRLMFLSSVPTLISILDELNIQELATIAWVYSVANVDAPSLFNDNFIKAILKKEDEFTVEALAQLYQWQLWQKELKSSTRLPRSLWEKSHEAFMIRIPQPSRFQNDVLSELSSIGLHPEEEVVTKNGYRLDALVEVHGSKIGIEVDGPSHFVSREPTGSTILKRRQVTSLDNIQVLSVPYWEWYKLGKDSRKKQKYLRTVLSLKCYKA